MSTTCYKLRCLTNLHAGSGDSGVGIIDKMIQRDSVTEFPVVYASSLKGAFREYFEEGPESHNLSALAEPIFGKMVRSETEQNDNGKGSHVFHEALLLSLPVGSNKAPFFNMTSKTSLKTWVRKAKLLLISIDSTLEEEINSLPDVQVDTPKILDQAVSGLFVGDFENVGNIDGRFPKLNELLGDKILLAHYDDFKEQCSDYSLPVIARNNLESGQSKNLWYEQIVPHESLFSFFTYCQDDKDDFQANIGTKVVQIGANASIGYGYCEINKI